MSSGSGTFSQTILDAREHWARGFAAIRERHNAGAPDWGGVKTVRAFSDLMDEVLLKLYAGVAEKFDPSLRKKFALVMHGGCGRREVAPFSDVDLMLLFQDEQTDELARFARQFVQDVNDAGLQLGFSMRTPRDACSLALQEPEIFTSLTESRLIGGNEEVFQSFFSRLTRLRQRRVRPLILSVIDARRKERKQFGETVYLLRPNVKKSRGALRDIHLIRWLGFLRFGNNNLEALQAERVIGDADATLIRESIEFLLRLRCELHFHWKRAEDGLGRNEQVRIAEKFGYTGYEGVLAVEELMSDYYRYTTEVGYITDRFAEISAVRRVIGKPHAAPINIQQLDGNFWMGPTFIGIESKYMDRLKTDLPELLRLSQLANLHGKLIDHDTWLAVRESMRTSEDIDFSEAASQRFMALLSNTSGLADILDSLHEMYVLEKLIPAIQRTRYLLQFNEYHKYTVDKHSLQAVREATKFEKSGSQVGRIYQGLRDRNLLHLALLFHDLGKGFIEDHSDVGARIAESCGRLLGLTHAEVEDVKFLVQHHLKMSHIAFHRDINDEDLVAEFAADVGSVRMLNMLYVLTCADISAVGPEALTPWKQGLLDELFLHAKNVLTGHASNELDTRYQLLYEEVAATSNDRETSDWLFLTATKLPRNYCREHKPPEIAAQLIALRNTEPKEVQCWIRKVPGGKLTELCLGKRESLRSGTFYKIAGMLASNGLRIRSADIKPIGNSLLWYWFRFKDEDFADPPAERLKEIRRKARQIALGSVDEPPTFRKPWIGDGGPAAKLALPDPQIIIDNETAHHATIIDVFAYSRMGLLYTISKKIFELKLDVRFARISTYGRQVIDVFYITDENGNKIRNRNRQSLIQQELLRVTENFLNQPIESSSRL